MLSNYRFIFLTALLTFFLGCDNDVPDTTPLTLKSAFVGSQQLQLNSSNNNIPIGINFSLIFSSAIDRNTSNTISLKQGTSAKPIDISFSSDNKTILISPIGGLDLSTNYILSISNELRSSNGAFFEGIDIPLKTIGDDLTLTTLRFNNEEVPTNTRALNIPIEGLTIEATFSTPLDPTTVTNSTFRIVGSGSTSATIQVTNDNKTIKLSLLNPLNYFSKYNLLISSSIKGQESQPYNGLQKDFFTSHNPTPKLPLLPNDEDDDNDNTNDLLSVVQKQTFKYFWDFAHPASGMARERNTSGDMVTSGGSGFGIMALIVGMQRNFITRAEGLERMDKILDFLETSDRFHGAWSHWINGNTGDVMSFSPNDNGGDLVETAFLVQGLITFRQYISNNSIPNSFNIVNRINTLWQAVEWDWYRQNDQNVLYWHWSADKGWIINMQISGWNEALIVYVLAASAPANNTIPKTVYDNGWARNGGMRNGSSYEGTVLPLGFEWGGPLFFTHYSWLGLDPTNLSDQYATSYWTQNVNHSLINYKYCVRNPKLYAGYTENSWGLTASDNHQGYSAHSPTNDLGVITPTAALSSFPYTPEESMRALKFFYYTMGDRLWGEYGFYDAFNPTENWYANSYLAIDQGPIIIMIENYRTGLLWDLFMSAPEVQTGLTKLGINY